MKKQITNKQLIYLSTKSGMTGNVFADHCNGIKGFANITKLIDCEDQIQKEGDKFRRVLQKEFGEQVPFERQKEYFDVLDKQISFDFPEIEISDEEFEALCTSIDRVKCLNLIRKVTPKK